MAFLSGDNVSPSARNRKSGKLCLDGNLRRVRPKFSSDEKSVGLVAADAERVRLRGRCGGAEHPRLGQNLRLQNLVELLAGQELLGEHQIVDALVGQKRLLRDLGRVG